MRARDTRGRAVTPPHIPVGAAGAGDRARSYLAEAVALAGRPDPRDRASAGWARSSPRLRRRVARALELDRDQRRSWVSWLAPPDGEGLRRALKAVERWLDAADSNWGRGAEPAGGPGRNPADPVPAGLASFAQARRPAGAAAWLGGLDRRLARAVEEIPRGWADGLTAGGRATPTDLEARIILAWAVVDALDEERERDPRTWADLDGLLQGWMGPSPLSTRLSRRADARSADLDAEGDDPRPAARTGLDLLDRVSREPVATVREGSPNHPDEEAVLVDLIARVGSGNHPSAGPTAARRHLAEGLRLVDPGWPGWSARDDEARRAGPAGDPGPGASMFYWDVRDRADEGDLLGLAYRGLGRSLLQAAREGGARIVPEVDPRTQGPAPASEADLDHLEPIWVPSADRAGTWLRWQRDASGRRLPVLGLGPDWPAGPEGAQALEWMRHDLADPPPDFPSLARWRRAARALPLRPGGVPDELRRARDEFRRETGTEEGLRAFAAFAEEAVKRPEGAEAAWLDLLRKQSWVTLVPEPDGAGGHRWPARVRHARSVPEHLAFRSSEEPGRFSAFERYAPSIAAARGTVDLLKSRAQACEAARRLCRGFRGLPPTRKAPLEAQAREAFLASLEAGLGLPADPACPPFDERANAVLLTRGLTDLLDSGAPDLDLAEDLLGSLRDYARSIGLRVVPGPEAWSLTGGLLGDFEGGPGAAPPVVKFGAPRTQLVDLGLIAADGEVLVPAVIWRFAGEAPPGWDELSALIESTTGPWAEDLRREIALWPEQWSTGEERRRKPRVIALFEAAYRDRPDAPPGEIRRIRDALFHLLEENYPNCELIEYQRGDPLAAAQESSYVAVKVTSADYRVKRMVRPGLRVGGVPWIPAEVER